MRASTWRYLGGGLILVFAAAWFFEGGLDLEDDPLLGPGGPSRGERIDRILDPLVFASDSVEPRQRAEAERADEELDAGFRQLEAGRRVVALEHFVRAVANDPDSAAAVEGLGAALRRLGRVEQALAAFRSSVYRDPFRASAHAEVAWTLAQIGRWRDSAAAWQQVLSLEPDNATAHARLATMYSLLGEDALAREHLGSVSQLSAVPEPLRFRLEHNQLPKARVESGAQRSAGIAVGPRVRIDVGGGSSQAAETSVAMSDAESPEVVAAWNDLRAAGANDAWSLGVGLSRDGGATWSDFLMRPAANTATDFEGDPMTAFDPRSGYLWVGGVTFFPGGNVFVARKAPGAASFEPVVVINDDDNFDKGWLAAGPAPGAPQATRLYVAYNLGLQFSTDLGATWSSLRSLASGVAQQPRVGPLGELYIAYWDFMDGVVLQRSFDGGDTISPPLTIARRMDVWTTQDGARFPGRFRVPSLNYLAVDPNDGTLYCVYFDTSEVTGGQANVDLYFTRSTNRGDSWTVPRVIHGDSDPPGDQFFPWLEVDALGRLHLLYLDTRHTPQLDDAVEGWFDAYYATSTDRGDSWTEARLTETPFSSSSATWPGFEQFLGDFVTLAVAGDQVVAVYPSTINGNLDIFAQRIELVGGIFSDGFESGATDAWN